MEEGNRIAPAGGAVRNYPTIHRWHPGGGARKLPRIAPHSHFQFIASASKTYSVNASKYPAFRSFNKLLAKETAQGRLPLIIRPPCPAQSPAPTCMDTAASELEGGGSMASGI